MAYRTLEALRAELLARLGMGGMGTSGGANQTLIDSFLRNGQAQLYWATDWKHLTDYSDNDLGASQNLLDYAAAGTMNPTFTCARDKRILRLETVYSGQWRLLYEGITTALWNTMDVESYPVRYERYAQLLIYPKADAVYTIRQWFVADLGRFTQNTDVATLDDEMILLHALANAKAHYRHPDAPTYQGQLDNLLSSLKGQQFGSNKVFRRDEAAPPLARPVTV